MDKLHLVLFFGVCLILFLLENLRSNKYLKSRSYDIVSDKIPESFHGVKIIFLSDLHNNELGKHNERLLKKIEKEHPDYVLVGGDMLVAKRKNSTEHAGAFMSTLSGR